MIKTSKILVAEIDPSTPYFVIDIQKKQVVGKFKYKDRNKARAFADKKDNEYGAHRFVCKVMPE